MRSRRTLRVSSFFSIYFVATILTPIELIEKEYIDREGSSYVYLA